MRLPSSAAWILVLSVPLLGLVSCDTAPRPDAPAADGPAAGGPRDEPVRLTDVPPPPGADLEALTPLAGTQRDAAQRPLADVLAAARPAAPDPRAAGPAEPAEPPLAAQKAYAIGRQALLEGDHFKAVQEFEKALRLAPRSPEILRSLGGAWARAGNRVTAAGHLRRAATVDPDDFESRLMLGRFAADDRRWDEAVSSFAGALELAESRAAVDPAAAPLLHFFLARALAESGRIGAADESLAAYLDAPRPARPARSGTARARELALIDAQRGETLTLRGDLAHRLNDPEAALSFYTAAADAGVMNPEGLRRRQLYTRLRLGQPRAARELALRAVVESHGDTAGLALLSYAVDHGVPASALSARLRTLYTEEGRPTALALAVADVLPPGDAAALLDEHLDARPDDAAALRRRMELALRPAGGAVSDEGLARAAALAAAAVRRAPDQAESFADPLLALVAEGGAVPGGPSALAGVFAAAPPAPPAPTNPTVPTVPSRDAADAYLYGRALEAAGRPDEARTAYEQSVALPEAPPAAREAWAELLIAAGDHAAAAEVLAPLTQLHRPRTDRLRVRALTDSGRHDEALALIDELLRDTTDAVPLLRQKGRLLLERGDLAGGERALLDALNAAPTHEDVYRDLLTLYEANPTMTRNLQRLWRRMIDTIPRARITREQLVALHLASGDHAAAERLLTPLLAETPDDAGLQSAAAELYAATGRTDELDALVARHLERSTALNRPPAEDVLQPAMNHARWAGDLDRLLELSDRYWTPRPPGAQRSLELARVRFTQERFAAAADIAAAGLEAGQAGGFDPPLNADQDAVLSSILSRSLLEDGRFAEAEAAIDRAMERRPEHAAALGQGLALAYEELERPDDAERLREKLLVRFPDDPQLCNTLGYAWANRGERLDEAATLIQRALDAEPDTAAYLDSMGWVRYKQARFDEAVALLERGRAAPGGDHAVIVDHVGDAYHRLGREADAVRAWTEAGERAAAAAQNPADPANGDPELKGLAERVAAKLRAVAERRPVPVADLGIGVVPPVEAAVASPIEAADAIDVASPDPEPVPAQSPDGPPETPASEPAAAAADPARGDTAVDAAAAP